MSRTKDAEGFRAAMDARLRVAGMTPKPIPIPEPDMRIADPRQRQKKHAKAALSVKHANDAALAKARDTARAQWFGCPAGRAIARLPEVRRAVQDAPDVPTLWEAICRVRATYERYRSAIDAPSLHARGMNLELLPEEFGSDGVEVSGEWDGRTEEERVKAATAAMMHLEAVLGMAGYGVAVEVKRVVLRDEPVKYLDRLILGLAAVAKDA